MDTSLTSSVAGQHHDVTPILDILICPNCRSQSLEIVNSDQMRCQNCNFQYQIVDGIPVLFKDGHPHSNVEYLIKINTDDISVYQGEDFYVQKGHAAHLVAEIDAKPDELVLDLGCDHGHVSKWIAQTSSAQVVSCDILLPVLIQVENPLVICSSADNLVFGDNTFDRIVFTDVLEHILPDMQDMVVSEIFRVLKPGGILYVDYPGSKLPYYSGYLALNVLIAILRLFGKKVKYYSISREPEAHVNLSYPHLVNRVFASHGFSGKLIPHTTKFFSIPEPYRSIARLSNIFPLNYLFSQQLIGKLRKPELRSSGLG